MLIPGWLMPPFPVTSSHEDNCIGSECLVLRTIADIIKKSNQGGRDCPHDLVSSIIVNLVNC